MSGAEKTVNSKENLPAGFRQGDCCTYLLECADGTLYCGWTNDLAGRLRAHNRGTGGKYTRARRPVTLVYAESFGTKREAMRREWEIKRLSREEKLKLTARRTQNPASREMQRLRENDGTEEGACARKKDGTEGT